jgi:hypothetical protein
LSSLRVTGRSIITAHPADLDIRSEYLTEITSVHQGLSEVHPTTWPHVAVDRAALCGGYGEAIRELPCYLPEGLMMGATFRHAAIAMAARCSVAAPMPAVAHTWRCDAGVQQMLARAGNPEASVSASRLPYSTTTGALA